MGRNVCVEISFLVGRKIRLGISFANPFWCIIFVEEMVAYTLGR